MSGTDNNIFYQVREDVKAMRSDLKSHSSQVMDVMNKIVEVQTTQNHLIDKLTTIEEEKISMQREIRDLQIDHVGAEKFETTSRRIHARIDDNENKISDVENSAKLSQDVLKRVERALWVLFAAVVSYYAFIAQSNAMQTIKSTAKWMIR